MKRRVRLFIGGMEVEFKTVPDILYNFKVDSLTDPAAIKNTYSKQIEIPATAQNNRIFNNFFLNDYNTYGANFDATKKTEFTLYVDSDAYETGYCKLVKVNQKKHAFSYSIELFGGLGEFFYNIAYSDNPQGDDEKKKLSDLTFYGSTEGVTPVELGFTINKETIKEAWDNIYTFDSKWGVINFAPAYNGVPSDFDSDKVLMNVGSAPNQSNTGIIKPAGGNARNGSIVTAVTEEGVDYQTYGGYALAELSREYTAAEMREFRSYLMRPVLNVQRTIEAICRPENNGGYTVELDPDFFHYDNPYWTDMWMTLSQLSSLEYTSSVVATGTTVSLGAKQAGTTTTGDPGYYEDVLAVLSSPDSGMAYDVNVRVNLDVQGVSNSSFDELVMCAYSPTYGFSHMSAIFVQLVAYDAFGTPVAGSDAHYITNVFSERRTGREGRVTESISASPEDWKYRLPYGNGYVKDRGYGFVKVSGSTYRWDNEFSLTAQNVPAGSTLKILVTKLYKAGGSQPGPKYLFKRFEDPGEYVRYSAVTFNDFNVTVNSSTVAFKTNEGIRTGASFSKKQLLDTNFSCYEFLTSYMKLFGLYAIKDTPEKKIKILTRRNFFHRDEIVDIQDLVDRSDLKITPLVFDNKWYNWNLEADESEYGKYYEQTFGKPYGQKKINTGYNFNRNTKEVLEGNIFKGAVQVLERSNAFCYTGDDTTWKPWMSPGYNYLLYSTVDAGDTYEVDVPASSTIDAYSALTEGYMFYDLFDKVQLHSANNNPADGANVLLIFCGTKDLKAGAISLNYYITDDSSYMNILNDGRPCWLFTNSETDNQQNSIATKVNNAPWFSRYQAFTGSGYIMRSLDFGKPEEIYVPGLYYREGSTIYEEFWQDYITDLYSKDSRVVKTKMLIRELPTVDWLRRFYSFDGSIWRMTEITDYNVGQEKLTEVQFVRVQDVENYTNELISSIPEIELTVSSNSIGGAGGTLTYAITVSDGGPWYIESDDLDVSSLSATQGVGNYQGTWTISQNNSASPRNLTLIALADNSSSRVTITQNAFNITFERINYTQDDIAGSGGTMDFRVICEETAWSADSGYNWVTFEGTHTGGPTTSEGTVITATVAPNTDNAYRRVVVYLELPTGARYNSYWMQAPPEGVYLSVTPSYIGNAPYSGTQYQIMVSSSESWNAYSMYPERLTLSQYRGNSGTTQITATLAANDGASRFASAYFYRDSISDQPASLTISQSANPSATITVSPQTITGFTAAGGTTTVQVTASNAWNGYLYDENLLASPTSGQSGTTNVTMTVTANTTGAERTLRYRFYIGNVNTLYTELEVVQQG